MNKWLSGLTLFLAIAIITPTLGLDHQGLKSTITSYYASAFNVPERDVVVELMDSPQLDFESVSTNDLEVSSRLRTPELGYQTLWLSVPSQGVHQVPVSVRLTLYKTVAVAGQTIDRGDYFTENNIVFKRMLLSSLSPEPVTATDKVFDYVAKQLVRQGNVVRKHMLKESPDLAVGDNVKVYMTKGPLTIVTSAKVKNDASIGERVWVLYDRTGKILTAKVSSPTAVEIQY